jgi:hypothetical protein
MAKVCERRTAAGKRMESYEEGSTRFSRPKLQPTRSIDPTIAERTQRVNGQKADEILACVPANPPLPGDQRLARLPRAIPWRLEMRVRRRSSRPARRPRNHPARASKSAPAAQRTGRRRTTRHSIQFSSAAMALSVGQHTRVEEERQAPCSRRAESGCKASWPRGQNSATDYGAGRLRRRMLVNDNYSFPPLTGKMPS